MNKNSFEFATKKQYDLAESIRNRIINDIKQMNINELNQVANTNFERKELVNFFEEKDDFKYFINQNNISTHGIVISALMKLRRK
ncbi:TPA: hypothetical protein PI874_002482 [Staphylococcus aureus]|uniref:hypothetical protein n=1 Tax=Staphylococcus aureus TaxID=1280 RepID=UPI00139F1FCC|nr:hypothetical protein [Staphylococcus aureus]NDP54631.1 hypothetical protein [Staphylococcus aureus]NDQ33514.1 hypothetical protein [Staphylococcus aureus]NDQ43856.1 hypothetical protein [Staphylococcus aureus]QID98757.1 hypothetical protein GZ067_13750 [Staphylococcus aureus]HDH6518339.1 hypothetical protein [Staphylococcus aureus]